MFEAFHTTAVSLPWFFPTLAFIFGALIGSFLNVCILRLPKGESIVFPGSHCACGKGLAWYDNIPLLSWLLLRGKARCCGRSFSFRYFFVEALCAGLFLLCWLSFPPGKALCGMVFIAVLLCATFIDLDHLLLPDSLTLGLALLGLLLSLGFPSLHGIENELPVIERFRSLLESFLGLMIGSGLLLWIALLAEALLKKEAMGFGDIKFLGAIGTFIGWQGCLTSLFGGALLGSLWIALAMGAQVLYPKQKNLLLKAETAEGKAAPLGFGVQVPFGPMLAAGALFHFFLIEPHLADFIEGFALLFRPSLS